MINVEVETKIKTYGMAIPSKSHREDVDTIISATKKLNDDNNSADNQERNKVKEVAQANVARGPKHKFARNIMHGRGPNGKNVGQGRQISMKR